MGETKNYKLHLTDNDSESFFEWRQKMNGTEDSNMQKIDKALGEKANRSVSISTVLLASSWSGSEAPFTQEIFIQELTAESNGSISVTYSATAEQRNTARCAMLSLSGQSDGKLVVVADGDLPEQDIPVCIIIYG